MAERESNVISIGQIYKSKNKKRRNPLLKITSFTDAQKDHEQDLVNLAHIGTNGKIDSTKTLVHLQVKTLIKHYSLIDDPAPFNLATI